MYCKLGNRALEVTRFIQMEASSKWQILYQNPDLMAPVNSLQDIKLFIGVKMWSDRAGIVCGESIL